MKKSNKKNKKTIDIQKEVEKDTEKLNNFINRLESIYELENLDKYEKEIKGLLKDVKKKYKDVDGSPF